MHLSLLNYETSQGGHGQLKGESLKEVEGQFLAMLTAHKAFLEPRLKREYIKVGDNEYLTGEPGVGYCIRGYKTGGGLFYDFPRDQWEEFRKKATLLLPYYGWYGECEIQFLAVMNRPEIERYLDGFGHLVDPQETPGLPQKYRVIFGNTKNIPWLLGRLRSGLLTAGYPVMDRLEDLLTEIKHWEKQ